MHLRVSPTLTLPSDAVTGTFALLAVRGAGKSTAAAVMAEEMFALGLPFVAIDPVGSWYGLRAGKDGSPRGGLAIPIFGGKRGDVPLERGAGQLLADLVVDKRLSCVLDLSQFDSEAAKKGLLLDFARRLYLRNESPLHLFLEEADDYIPQSPQRDEAQLLRAWENIVRRGRGRGIGVTLITQRSAAINKMVLYMCETLFAMRTVGPGDIKTVEAWVKYHNVDTGLLKSLASLEDGEAWVWSPHYLKKLEKFRFRQRKTFDSGATPKNLTSKTTRRAATLADVDLDLVREQMAATIEEAKKSDPRLLRQRIAELERDLARKPVTAAPTVQIKEVPVVTDKQLLQLTATAEKLADGAKELHNASEAILGAVRTVRLNGIAAGRGETPKRGPFQRPEAPPAAFPMTGRLAATRAAGAAGTDDAPRVDKCSSAILAVLAQHPDGCEAGRLTLLSGYKWTGSFRNALSSLRTNGLLVGSNKEHMRATPAGLAAVADVDARAVHPGAVRSAASERDRCRGGRRRFLVRHGHDDRDARHRTFAPRLRPPRVGPTRTRRPHLREVRHEPLRRSDGLGPLPPAGASASLAHRLRAGSRPVAVETPRVEGHQRLDRVGATQIVCAVEHAR